MEIGLIVHVLILNTEGKLLVLRRQKNDNVLPGYWDIPGGTLEVGEDPAVGAAREAREECGLEVEHLRIVHFTSNIDQEKNKQFVRLIFQARAKTDNIKLNPEEHDHYRWIDPVREEISNGVDLAHPDDLKYVDYLKGCFGLLIARS
ncbi:MAG: NUDIX hydrolase [Candidatus Komeilibacteria bacterium]